MRLLPLLLTLVVGVALWAAPTSAQVVSWWARYTADSAAPGEGVSALGDGYELCPPNLNNCTNYSQAHHHIDDASGAYNTDVLDIHSCGMVTVCLATDDTDGVTAAAFVEVVKENADTVPLQILADVNGDGVINLADEVPLDGDDGSDNDGDNTARQTACMYGITGNKMQMAVQNGGGGANEEAYLEVSCR
jgi:hypothetical protein